ncbi:MAG TPA: hypothetical protein VFE32_17015 [Puia sp.]|jgi:hypothetical protein|nr:hypothetical protein [Puia sp.]
MKLNTISVLLLLITCLSVYACSHSDGATGLRLNGTWQLISGMTITGRDTVPYATDFRMIKIVNDTHFAFLRHDKNPSKDSSNHFDGGGGNYTLTGNKYTEHLDYYADRNWEGKPFTFTVELRGDTLIQTGIEKVDAAHVDHIIIEKYVRVDTAGSPGK